MGIHLHITPLFHQRPMYLSHKMNGLTGYDKQVEVYSWHCLHFRSFQDGIKNPVNKNKNTST